LKYFLLLFPVFSSILLNAAHNPKVRGSNPLPATKLIEGYGIHEPFFFGDFLARWLSRDVYPSSLVAKNVVQRILNRCEDAVSSRFSFV